MRVLFITPYYLPWVGGLEILVNQLGTELRSRGHEIVILTSHRDEAPAGLDEIDGVPVFRFDANEAIATRDLQRIFQVQTDIARIDGWFEPDVVHAHDVGPMLWLYQRAVRRRRRPLVVTLHNVMSRQFVGSLSVLRKMLAQADWVTGVSRAVVDDTHTYAPELASRMSTIENGIADPSPDPTSPLPFDPPRLLCIGRLVKQKGFDVAIEAMARVTTAHPGVRLQIAGSGPEDRRLRALATDLGIDGHVDFLGTVDREGVTDLLRAATAVVMPSRFEGLPLVALEAAWTGRPVVASTAPGIGSVIVDGETGLLVDVDDPDAFANAISGLIADPPRAQALGRGARAMAEREYSLSRCADGYEQVYRALIRPGRPLEGLQRPR